MDFNERNALLHVLRGYTVNSVLPSSSHTDEDYVALEKEMQECLLKRRALEQEMHKQKQEMYQCLLKCNGLCTTGVGLIKKGVKKEDVAEIHKGVNMFEDLNHTLIAMGERIDSWKL